MKSGPSALQSKIDNRKSAILMKSCRNAVLAVAYLCALPLSGAAAWKAECLSVKSRILNHSVGYCALLPPSYDTAKTKKYPVLYYLHGLGDNQQMFLHAGGLNMVEDEWERGEIGEFVLVTPEGGRTFYINSRDGRERYEDFFLREFMPYIESHYRIERGRKFRGIAGISMGGYGALHLAFRHPGLFASVSAGSAAIIEDLPNVKLQGSQQAAVGRIFGGAFGNPVDPAFVARESPLTLARTLRPAGLKIYFDCGDKDDYGFERGAAALDKILTARHIPHEYHLYPGGHNWMYFAGHIPASLEFHSHAFGLKGGK
ncbi:MAG: alpha/beta hydrolase [Deltaproteobacteria bacterium]